jgi:lactoylglutathione lyase
VHFGLANFPVAYCGLKIITSLSLRFPDFQRLIERLQQYQIIFFERTVPLTSEHQVFIEGPEGLRVEVQFSKGI